MKNRLQKIALSVRLIALCVPLCGSALLACAASGVGRIVAATACGAALLGLWGLVYAPLRRLERAADNKASALQPVEARLARLGALSAAEPLSRSLAALADDVRAQYTEALIGTQAELDTLQSQINPHFLYNTLDSIRGQALFQGVSDIAEMTEALSTFFRYSISNRDSIVSLEQELENVRNYFRIQQFRFNNRFRLSILPTQRENLEQCRLPKLTLQPIVENAILHGMESMLGAGTITIRVQGTERLVTVTVADDGRGMGAQPLQRLQARVRGEAVEGGSRRGGLALPNIARRIRLLFGDAADLQIMSTPGMGTDVILTLPRSIDGEACHEA